MHIVLKQGSIDKPLTFNNGLYTRGGHYRNILVEFTTLQVSSRETVGGKTQISLYTSKTQATPVAKRVWLRQTIILYAVGGERSEENSSRDFFVASFSLHQLR